MYLEENIIWPVLTLCYGLVSFGYGFYWLKIKRLIENIPTSKIRGLAMGLVEVFGEVIPLKNKTMRSPLLGEECICYFYRIEEFMGVGKAGYWNIVNEGEKSVYFYLKDDTGKVLVDPKDADISFPKMSVSKVILEKDLPKKTYEFMKEQGAVKNLIRTNTKLRFTEWLIGPKDKLYVLGCAGDNPFVKEASAQKGIEDIMIKKGENHPAFYISDKREKRVVKRYMLKVILGIYLGSIVCIISFIMIVYYLVLSLS